MPNPYAPKAKKEVVPVEEKAEAVPEGSIKELLEWVGDDKERAQRVLDSELEGKGRKTLIDELEEVLNG